MVFLLTCLCLYEQLFLKNGLISQMFCPPYCLLEEMLTSWTGKMSGATVVCLFTVRASIYLHDTMSHAITWISSCDCMLRIHVFACRIVMYSHDCGHLCAWHHASTCHVACINMTKDACIYMTSTIFHRNCNFPVFVHFQALVVGVPKHVYSYHPYTQWWLIFRWI